MSRRIIGPSGYRKIQRSKKHAADPNTITSDNQPDGSAGHMNIPWTTPDIPPVNRSAAAQSKNNNRRKAK